MEPRTHEVVASAVETQLGEDAATTADWWDSYLTTGGMEPPSAEAEDKKRKRADTKEVKIDAVLEHLQTTAALPPIAAEVVNCFKGNQHRANKHRDALKAAIESKLSAKFHRNGWVEVAAAPWEAARAAAEAARAAAQAAPAAPPAALPPAAPPPAAPAPAPAAGPLQHALVAVPAAAAQTGEGGSSARHALVPAATTPAAAAAGPPPTVADPQTQVVAQLTHVAHTALAEKQEMHEKQQDMQRQLDEQAHRLKVEQARREVLECMLRLGELNFKGEVTRAEVAGVLRGAEDLASRMLARAPP